VLSLNNASSEGLRAWLSEARSAARVRPVEMQLQRSPQGYSGSLTVQLPGSP
jgi:general secretion pathway protein M